MKDIAKLKQTLRELLADHGIDDVLKELEAQLPPDVPKFNTVVQFKARNNEIKNQLNNRIITLEQQLHQQNLLQYDVLAFVSDLLESDFSLEAAKKANMGGVLYRIPDRMQHLKKSKCIVRVAYDESVLKDKLDMTVDVVIEALKVSKNMEVKLVDEEGDGEYFEITSRSTPEQFLVQDEYTEWTFFVKPLEVGTYPLALIISLVIYEDGKDRKKDITLERTISVITEPVPEEAGDHTLRKAGILFALRDPNAPEGGKKTDKKPLNKLLTAALILLLLALLGWLGWLFWPKADLGVFSLDGSGGGDGIAQQEAQDYNDAINNTSPELLIAFLAKYKDSKYEVKVRQWASKKIPKVNLDSAVTAYRTKHRVEPIERGGSKTRDASNKNTTDSPISDAGKLPQGDPIAAPINPSSVPGSTNPTDKPDASTGGKPATQNEKPDPTTAPPATGDPTKPEAIRHDDRLRAKEDPLNWLPATMVKVKGGRFKMGCNFKLESTGCAAFAEPAHEVKVEDFSISRYEVTQALWKAVMGDRKNPSKFNDCDLCPVEGISWKDAQDFIKKLNRKTGGNYRLPTEAEWEYAARQGGKDIRFGDGSNTAKTVNINFNSEDLPGRKFVEAGEFRKRTIDVFNLKANTLGLVHMSGNVAEWCEDRWHPDYEGAPTDGSAWLDGDDNRRVVRGGGWDTEPYASRTYDRDAKKESTGDDEVGFRVVW